MTLTLFGPIVCVPYPIQLVNQLQLQYQLPQRSSKVLHQALVFPLLLIPYTTYDGNVIRGLLHVAWLWAVLEVRGVQEGGSTVTMKFFCAAVLQPVIPWSPYEVVCNPSQQMHVLYISQWGSGDGYAGEIREHDHYSTFPLIEMRTILIWQV